MDVTPLVPKGRQLITGYGQGGFKINHEAISGSLLVFADHHLPWNGEITAQQLAPILNASPAVELFLLGSGQRIVPLAADMRQLLKSKNISVDVMDTGAACRTFNILMSEERRIAAALVAV